MRSSGAACSIGDAAARFGVAPHVLRHWEAEGLLHPGRDAAGRRVYGEADLRRIIAIRRGKAGGLPLDAIRIMLDAADGDTRRAVLTRHRDELHARIAEARAALELLECALGCRHDDLAECPEYRRLLGLHEVSSGGGAEGCRTSPVPDAAG